MAPPPNDDMSPDHAEADAAPPVPRWLPNAISIVRILLVPVWVVCAELGNDAATAPHDGTGAATWRFAATAVLVAIGLSDVLDGWLARRFRLQTRVGAVVDAVADKLAQVVLFTWLTLRAEPPAFAPMPWWFLALLLARDVLLAAGYLTIRRRAGSVNAEHRLHGRVASLLLFLLLVAGSANAPPALVRPLLAAATAFVVASTAFYVHRGAREFAGAR